MFKIFGETLKRNTIFSNSVDSFVTSKLASSIAEERRVFDQYCAVQTKQFFSLVRSFKKMCCLMKCLKDMFINYIVSLFPVNNIKPILKSINQRQYVALRNTYGYYAQFTQTRIQN